MTVPEKVAELVERFEEQRDDYRSARYNETLLRRDFLDPFFTALGWDVDNRKGYSEPFREVSHEYGLRVRGGTQAVDYCFRLGREPIFLVEAKKPAVDIRRDAGAAYQLRDYGWNLKLPASILTDFEEFAVYDCRAAPAKSDRAGTGRLIYWKYTEYLDHWDRLVELFSPEGIRRGGLDKFVSSKRPRKGTEPVDARFLREIESWRDVLARNLALRNKGLSQRELNFAVQRTIDRTIFLRICEDRAIEPYGTLQGLLAGPNIYRRLGQLFERADDRYNSGLFYFSQEKDRPDPPDELTLGLAIDDNALKTIIKGLYEGPYNFSVLPVEILGQVYEQFLGKVIRLTKGHQAKVEEKPEVKKAGGVYYTPKYIVDYIVEHTVGKLLGGGGKAEAGRTKGEGRLAAGGTAESAARLAAGGTAARTARLAAGGTAARTTKTPKQAAKLRILDPACDSGSFLLGAYQYLLDWHLEQYVAAGPERRARGKSPAVFKDRRGRWRLTTAEKKRILLNNIYGVDIDPQAVEVTKLSLLLKVLEGESQKSLETQLRFAHERALPDLGTNIKCGNSLIGPDFYDDRQMSLLDEEQRYRINVFDWKAAFPEVFKGKNPGFDAVIGNPPYIRMELFKDLKQYLREHFQTHDERTYLYVYFIERSIGILSPQGAYGVIVSNKWMRSAYGARLREFVAERTKIKHLINFGELPVFESAGTMPAVIVLRKYERPPQYTFAYTPSFARDLFKSIASGTVSLSDAENTHAVEVGSGVLLAKGWQLVVARTQELLNKLNSIGQSLFDYTGGQIRYGIKTGLVKAFVIDEQTRNELVTRSPGAAEIIKPYLIGDDIRHYHIHNKKRHLIYTYHGVDMEGCKSLLEHLAPFRRRLEKRATKYRWYELQQPQPRYAKDYEAQKIIYPDIAKESRFALDDQSRYCADTTFVIPLRDLYLLGILNSRLAFFYFSMVCPVLGDARRGGRLRLKLNYVKELPIRALDLSKRCEKSRHERMVELVEGMLRLHKQLAAARTPQDKTVIQRQIDATDRQIDRLVYELYELTDEEIAIVEEATKPE